MTDDFSPSTAAHLGRLDKYENYFGKVPQRKYYKFCFYLTLSSFIHYGLFSATGCDGLKSTEKESRIIGQSSNTLLATINIQPSIMQYPTATAKIKDSTLAATAPDQLNSKILPIETSRVPAISMRYFEGKELTLQPKLKGSIALDNPESATMPETGTVQLRLLLNVKGSVDKVIVDKASLPEVFVESVKHSFLSASFKPGEIDGLAVQSQFFVEINYEASISK